METLRDLVIIISGLVVTLVAIIVAVISCLAYSRVNGILKSAKTSAAKIEALTTVATDDIGKPLIQAAGLVQGIAYGFQAIRKMTKRRVT